MGEEKALTVINATPALTNEQHHEYMAQMKAFVKEEMIEEADYGVIPGTKDKTLYDPGAEKLARRYELVPEFEAVSEIEDFEKGFFFYKYKCLLYHGPTHILVGEAIRICTSKEKKYSQYTKAEKWATEEEKQNAIGRKQNTKYHTTDLILRKTPDEIIELSNTIISMAQKRAFVEAVRTATMTSSIFKGADVRADATAPDRPVTKAEDPYRNRIQMRLYATAKDHGWNDAWIHKAIKKKWDKDSLTNISTEQIEELTEFIITTYQTVNPGEKPVLRNAAPAAPAVETSASTSENIIEPEKETQPAAAPATCRNTKKHGDNAPIVNHPEGAEYNNPYFCDNDCQVEYWGEKPKSKLEEYLEKGRAKKREAEAQGEKLPEVLPDVEHPPVNMG